jgi:outer membrane murein-binding lipoprotein Lpp
VEKFKKIDKEYCITDDSVNVYKYRCLTAGLQLDEVKKNPIGFLMHKRDKGVVVRWEDFRIDGSKLYAKPVVNLAHPEGASIVDQIENGFLNAASVGHIVCLDASDDASLKLEGQTGPTVTKWFPREISLVDIPGNYNALVNLYDIEDNELNLADFVKPNNNNMSKVLLTAVMLTALNLSDNAAEHEANKAFQDLLDRAKKVDGLEKDLVAKTTELDALKKTAITKELADLVAKGIAEKKLTKEMAEKLAIDYSENPTGLKSLIDTMPAQISVVGALANPELAAKFEGKSWDDLYASDELETVRVKFPDLFERLKSEKYPKK